MRVAVITLGCKLNFAESSAIARRFVESGFEEVSPDSAAELYIVNTCTVTEHSDKKCRNLIRKAHKRNPNAVIAVTGCYAELKQAEIEAIEGVSIVLGQSRKGDIYSECMRLLNSRTAEGSLQQSGKDEVFAACSFTERTRAFLKVQDGCNYFCTYCAIPYARGRSRSVPLHILVEQAEEAAGRGVKEIVLTGVNIGDYKGGLLPVLKRLNAVEGIERFRISSIEPNLLTEEMIRWIASGTKFQPHFHIPLQSGCDATLLRMRRRYDTSLFANKIELIRDIMGDLFFGIDVITGFPGENESEFEQTYNFLANKILPAHIHIFPYSRRENTSAYSMPNQVDERVKRERVAKLEELSAALQESYYSRFAGTTQQVLFEGRVKERPSLMGGYTGNYIRVERPYEEEAIGSIKEIVL